MPLFNFLLLPVTFVADPNSLDPSQPVASDGMGQFITDFFPLMVKIIAALAVLYIAYWGITYMLSNVAGIKTASKDRIWDILKGLLLALCAYLILQIINPNIVDSLKSFVSK